MPGFNVLYEGPSNAVWQIFLGWPRRQGDTFISVSIEVGLAQASKSRHFDLDIPRALTVVAMLAPVAMIQHWGKQPGEERVYLAHRPIRRESQWGPQSRNWRETTEGYCLLGCFRIPFLHFFPDLYRVLPPQQAGTFHIYQQSRKLLTRQSDGGGSVTEIPSSQLSLVLCQADKN